MIKELIKKIKSKVESLGEEVERIELADDGCSILIKIKKSDHIDDDFYLYGEHQTIIDSLIEIKNNSILDLITEIEEVEEQWKDWDATCKDTDKYLKQQGWN